MRKMKIDIYIINILLFTLPLIYLSGFGSYNSLRYFFFGTMALVLSIFTIYRFLNNKWLLSSFFKNWYSYGIIAYLISFFVVSVTSIDRNSSFFSSFQRTDGFFAILFLFFFALSIYSVVSLYGQKVVRQFLLSSVLGATVLSLFILFSPEGFSFLNSSWLIDSRGGAMLGNSSVAASYTLWNVFFAIILFTKSESLKNKVFLGCFFLILILSPLFLNWHLILGGDTYRGLTSLLGSARGASLGIIFGLMVACGSWLSFQEVKIKKYLGLIILIIVFTGVILGGVSILNKTSVLHQKFAENVGENRFIFWDSAIKGFEESPFSGIGPNNFEYSFHKFFNADILLLKNGSEVLVDRTHNIFFETLVGGGMLLMLALCFLFVSIIFGLTKLLKNKQLSELEAAIFIGMFFGWLLQAQFVFDSINSLVMLFLICGISYGSFVNKPDDTKQKNNLISTKEKFIITFFIFIIITFFIYSIALPYKKNRIMYKIYNTSLPHRADLWQNLDDISPMGDSGDSVLIFNNIFRNYDKEKQNIRNWDANKKEIILKELDAITNHLLDLTNKKDDYNLILFAAKMMYIRMYIANNIATPMFKETQSLLQRAMTLSPADPQPYWVLLQLEAANGNFEETKNLLEKAAMLQPQLVYTHKLILQFARNTNNRKYYLFALNRAKQTIPNFSVNEVDN